MNRRPLKKTSGIEYMVGDGESKRVPGKLPEKKRRERMMEKRRNPKGEREQTPQYQRYERRDGKRT